MVRLFPEVPPDHPAMGAIILNISANVLGLGNAATPFGIRAMQEFAASDAVSPIHAVKHIIRDILEKDSTLAVPDELQQTLAAARFQLEGESTETYQLVTTLKEVESAARALREFLDLMEAKPESLIRGKSNTQN